MTESLSPEPASIHTLKGADLVEMVDLIAITDALLAGLCHYPKFAEMIARQAGKKEGLTDKALAEILTLMEMEMQIGEDGPLPSQEGSDPPNPSI